MKANVLTHLRDSLVFFRSFVRHPLATGAIVPSSGALARSLLDLGRVAPGSVVAEFGPGTGSCTAHVLRRIGPEGRLIAFETNPRFVNMLQERFPEGTFIHDGAQNAPEHLERLGIQEVDAIVCGLPFGTIPVNVQTEIMAAARTILKTNGTFTSFQYCVSIPFSRTRRFRAMLSEHFTDYVWKPVWRNLPPAIVLGASNNGRGISKN